MRCELISLQCRISDHEDNLASTTLLRQCMRFGRILERQALADRQHKFTVSNVIGKLSHFRRIGLRENTSDLDARIRRGHAVGKYRGITKTPAILHLGEELGSRLTA